MTYKLPVRFSNSLSSYITNYYICIFVRVSISFVLRQLYLSVKDSSTTYPEVGKIQGGPWVSPQFERIPCLQCQTNSLISGRESRFKVTRRLGRSKYNFKVRLFQKHEELFWYQTKQMVPT